MDRRNFIKGAAAGALTAAAGFAQGKKIRVALVGCGSVSTQYLPDMAKSPFIELVSVCDVIPERAQKAGAKYNVPAFPHIDKQLSGPDFDLLVNTTSMPAHYPLNKRALEKGKHVWSEKPMALEVSQAQELMKLAAAKGVKIWAAPAVVTSPQFAFMAKQIAGGKLGRLAAGHAFYGHDGELWSAWFFQPGGGSLYDLGVYNVTTLTGLLGPAKSVIGMTGIGASERTLTDGTRVKVETEDNNMLIIDHGQAVFSHIQSGYNYYSPDGHSGKTERYTIDVIGSKGHMHLVGYDWAPKGVDMLTATMSDVERFATDTHGYVWQWGASYIAEHLATGKPSLITGEHAVHVLEVMNACHESSRTGRRVPVHTAFHWPIVA